MVDLTQQSLTDTSLPETVNELPEKDEFVLSDEDITRSLELQKTGALAGDKIVNGELVREVSEEPRGEIITNMDLIRSPELIEEGAEVGDIIQDGELIKSGENEPLRNFLYSYKEAQSPLQNLSTYLESRIPLGTITFDLEDGLQYISPEDYSDDFMQQDPEQRREFLVNKRLEALESDREQFEPTGSLTGTIAGSLDPSVLLPIGSTLPRMTGIGAGLGVAYESADQLAETGEVDPSTLPQAGAIGGASALGVGLVGKGIEKAYKSVTKPNITKQANETLNRAEQIIAREITKGTRKSEIPNVLREDMNLDDKQLSEVVSNAGRKLQVPTTQAQAERVLAHQIATDSAVSRQKSGAIDRLLGTLSTRVKNISVPVFGRLRRYESNAHQQTATKLQRADDFLQTIQSAPKSVQTNLNRQLLNGNYDAAKALIRTYNPDAVNLVDDIPKLLDETFEELKSAGHTDLVKRDKYFPRVVKDLEGLLNSMGRAKKSEVDRAIEKFAENKGVPIDKVTLEEQGEIIDKILRGFRLTTDGQKLRFAKPRRIETITPEQLQYYASPAESLQMYIRNAVNDIERRKFFGRAQENNDAGVLDVNRSIGRFIAEEKQKGNVASDDVAELSEMLASRFVGGEQTPGQITQFLRDTGYAGTIANPISAITQLGDLATSGAMYGVRNTLVSMFSPKQVKVVDLGLQRTISEEMVNPSATGRILNNLFKASGFQRVDQLGKETTINAALRRFQNLARTEKGRSQLRKEYGEVFGEEFDSLINDLQARVVSPNVKELAFNVISDVQPVTRSEMPQTYLENPNGRLLYMLKSFTLKQYDIARRNIMQEWNKGNKMKAVRNASLLFGYLAAANTGTQIAKDILLGREVSPEEIPDRAMWALLGVYGFNQYLSERYFERGDIKGAAANILMPATPLMDSALSLGKQLSDEDKEDDTAMTYLRSIPVVGPIVYAWFGGGAEDYNERREQTGSVLD